MEEKLFAEGLQKKQDDAQLTHDKPKPAKTNNE